MATDVAANNPLLGKCFFSDGLREFLSKILFGNWQGKEMFFL